MNQIDTEQARHLLSDIERDCECPICGELPIAPARIKIIEDIKTLEYTIGSCLKHWSVCNDIFCKSCIIKLFYHAQCEHKSMNRLKCPVCAQSILASKDMNSYMDCIIEDKRARNIVNIFQKNKILMCRFDCGHSSTDADEMYTHMYRGQCPKQIIECPVRGCMEFHPENEMAAHTDMCAFAKIKCPFCEVDLFNNSDVLPHMREVHKITSASLTVSITDLLN